MKKIISLVLSGLMLLSCFAFTASAKDFEVSADGDVAIAIDDVNAVAGDTVTVKVYVKFADGHKGISDGNFVINYPNDKLELVVEKELNEDEELVVTNPKWTFPGALIPNVEILENNNTLSINAGFMNPATGNNATAGDFFEMQFKVKEGVTGKVDITFDENPDNTYFNNTKSYMPTPVALETINGSINVAVPEYTVTYATDKTGVTVPDAVTKTSGTIIELPALSDLDDVKFAGWVEDGTTEPVYTDEYTVTKNVTLNAAWVPYNYYTVSYDGVALTDKVKEGTTITLTEKADTDEADYTGWKIDGEDYVYDFGDEYIVKSDVNFVSVYTSKYTVSFETAHGTAPKNMTVLDGTEITLNALSHDDLTFLGWKINGEGEYVTSHTVVGDVKFVADWKAAGKIFISNSGDDENDGFTAQKPVKTLAKANTLLASGDVNTLVVVGTFTTQVNDSLGVKVDGVGKTITVTGYDENAVFDYDARKGGNDDNIVLAGPIIFKNIKINEGSGDGRIQANGNALTFDVGVTLYNANAPLDVAANGGTNYTGAPNKYIINSGKFSKLFPGNFSNATYSGETEITVNNGEIALLGLGWGYKGCTTFKGKLNVTINGGAIDAISLDAGRPKYGNVLTENSYGNSSAIGYSGLRYYTLNGGTVNRIITTSIDTYNGENKVANRDGVTVFEINKPDIVVSNIHPGRTATDNATRIVIYNNGSFKADQVTDTGAIVLNATGAKLSAVVDVAKDYSTTIKGLSYTFPETTLAADYNAVKVGDTIYKISELQDNLIPMPTTAGTYEVSFLNAYRVTVGGESKMVPAGEIYELERLSPNGNLKHVGWATTENADTAEITGYSKDDSVIEYTPTADVTLYPVWAEATVYTVTFVTSHGTAPEALSASDFDEDGSEEITIPATYTYDGKVDDHFTFTGWVNGENTYAAGQKIIVTESITLTAAWDEDAKATVTYVDNYGTAPEAVTDYVGTEITIAAPSEVENFNFRGWVEGENVYAAGDKLVIDADGATLTAKWEVEISVNIAGAKGELELPISGAIGEEIDLPTTINVTKANHTFKGFSLTPDGAVITGKYTVNPDDTLYIIWEEDVDDAAIIETKVTYNTATNDYVVDMYYYGKDANTVGFGYSYGENLEFVSFTPAVGLSAIPEALETKAEGYYAYGVTNEMNGRIEGAAATAGNGIHLGTINFTYKLDKENYAKDDAADNIAITAPKVVSDLIASTEYFLYTPALSDLTVEGLPVVFDQAIEYEIIDVVYTVKGSVKVIRSDANAPKNFAEIKVLNEQGNLYKVFTIEDAATTTTDGVFEYEIGLSEGKYKFVIDKTGYLPYEFDVEIAAQPGAGEDGFVATPVNVDLAVLTPGDVVAEFGTIDLLDFAGITSSFGRGDLTAEHTLALDINEDGSVGVDDLLYVKKFLTAE